jgi:hypothetical protein
MVVECKSFLHSTGVKAPSFEKDGRLNNRYKLFNGPTLWSVVRKRLVTQVVKCGLCRPRPRVRLCLAAGKVKNHDFEGLSALFKKRGWVLWDADWLETRLKAMARGGYDDQVASVVAKLLVHKVKR